MPKLTVYELLRQKGQRQFTEISTESLDEAAAAAEAGIDIIITSGPMAKLVRAVAPEVFLIAAPAGRFSESNDLAVRLGLDAMESGANAVYCGTHSMARIEAMADVAIPVIGHVGYLPFRTNWHGGPRAIGKTAAEALSVYRRTKAYENAGAIGVEMEVVPERIAAAIAKRVRLCVISLGSGRHCDAQYLFAEDILGTHAKHYPRHARTYVKLKPEYDRIRGLMVGAFRQYAQEVQGGAFPADEHVVKVKKEEYAGFLDALDREPAPPPRRVAWPVEPIL
jgi:3-methyl-2-oxobutanoate hydroxymethyltransferase